MEFLICLLQVVYFDGRGQIGHWCRWSETCFGWFCGSPFTEVFSKKSNSLSTDSVAVAVERNGNVVFGDVVV